MRGNGTDDTSTVGSDLFAKGSVTAAAHFQVSRGSSKPSSALIPEVRQQETLHFVQEDQTAEVFWGGKGIMSLSRNL